MQQGQKAGALPKTRPLRPASTEPCQEAAGTAQPRRHGQKSHHGSFPRAAAVKHPRSSIFVVHKPSLAACSELHYKEARAEERRRGRAGSYSGFFGVNLCRKRAGHAAGGCGAPPGHRLPQPPAEERSATAGAGPPLPSPVPRSGDPLRSPGGKRGDPPGSPQGRRPRSPPGAGRRPAAASASASSAAAPAPAPAPRRPPPAAIGRPRPGPGRALCSREAGGRGLRAGPTKRASVCEPRGKRGLGLLRAQRLDSPCPLQAPECRSGRPPMPSLTPLSRGGPGPAGALRGSSNSRRPQNPPRA